MTELHKIRTLGTYHVEEVEQEQVAQEQSGAMVMVVRRAAAIELLEFG